MIPSQFRALLKTGDGKFLEYGYAQAEPESHSVEFWNEFVPLLRMGESATIVRLIEDQEAHVFTGEVYISSPRLLRLVSVTDEVLTPELELPIDTEIPALVTALGQPTRVSRFPFSKSTAPKLPTGEVAATIYTISPEFLTFRCAYDFPIGQKLLLSTLSEPYLQDIELEVVLIMAFGFEGTGHKCTLAPLCAQQRESLSHFMRQAHTLFPDTDGEN